MRSSRSKSCGFFFQFYLEESTLNNLWDLPLINPLNKNKPIKTSGTKKKALYCKENIKADSNAFPAEKKIIPDIT